MLFVGPPKHIRNPKQSEADTCKALLVRKTKFLFTLLRTVHSGFPLPAASECIIAQQRHTCARKNPSLRRIVQRGRRVTAPITARCITSASACTSTLSGAFCRSSLPIIPPLAGLNAFQLIRINRPIQRIKIDHRFYARDSRRQPVASLASSLLFDGPTARVPGSDLSAAEQDSWNVCPSP